LEWETTRWKDMNEHEKIDRVGYIVIHGGFSLLILAVLFQIGRALIYG
jgi:hypothetical protein